MPARRRQGLRDEALGAGGAAGGDAAGAQGEDLSERADVGSAAGQAGWRRQRDRAGDVAHRHAERSRAGGTATARQRPDDVTDRRQLVPQRQDGGNVSRASEAEIEPGEWAGTIAICHRVELELTDEMTFVAR